VNTRALTRGLNIMVLLLVCALAVPGWPGSLTDRPKPVPNLSALPEAAMVPVTTASATPSLFQSAMKPLMDEAFRRRQERWTKDPAAATRVDQQLNAQRINFLLFGYGETHEPPITERAFIGSYTIASYDLASGRMDLVSFTHDIRGPEIERFARKQGQEKVTPIRIDRAYQMGGFDLTREVMEGATGLSLDYQVAFDDGALAGAIDKVFGGINIDVPATFTVNAFYLRNVKYPGATFTKGPQVLTGTQVLQFIKTVPVEQIYDKELEHNARKHRAVRALMDNLKGHATDIGFWIGALGFFNSELSGGGIAYDFDVARLVSGNLGSLLATAGQAFSGKDNSQSDSVPGVRHSVYVVDIASGDGGVQWVKADMAQNPITRAEVDSGLYVDLAMEVPYNSDPNSPDLAWGYWRSVRSLVNQRFTQHEKWVTNEVCPTATYCRG
jgi:hypothetical protein